MRREVFNLFLIVRYFVSFVFSVATILLMLRFVLRLFSANPEASFVRWVYDTTSPLIAPFVGIFPNPQTEGLVLELSTLFALIMYAIVYFAVVEVIELFARLSIERASRVVVREGS